MKCQKLPEVKTVTSPDLWGAEAAYRQFVASRAKELETSALCLHHATTGMCGEAGEALDITKKMWIYEQQLHTTNKEGVTHEKHLLEEMGDLLFYLTMLCIYLDVSLAELMQSNTAKLTKRYPTGYSDKAALERADKNA